MHSLSNQFSLLLKNSMLHCCTSQNLEKLALLAGEAVLGYIFAYDINRFGMRLFAEAGLCFRKQSFQTKKFFFWPSRLLAVELLNHF